MSSRSGGKSGAKPKSCVKCEGKGWTVLTTPVGGLVDEHIFLLKCLSRWVVLSLGNKGSDARIARGKA